MAQGSDGEALKSVAQPHFVAVSRCTLNLSSEASPKQGLDILQRWHRFLSKKAVVKGGHACLVPMYDLICNHLATEVYAVHAQHPRSVLNQLGGARLLPLSELHASGMDMISSLLELKRYGHSHGHVTPAVYAVSAQRQILLSDWWWNVLGLQITPSEPYCAPEGRIGFAGDVWSVGVILLELALGIRLRTIRQVLHIRKRIDPRHDAVSVYYDSLIDSASSPVSEAPLHFRGNARKTLPADFRSLLCLCLHPLASRRPTLEALYKMFKELNVPDAEAEEHMDSRPQRPPFVSRWELDTTRHRAVFQGKWVRHPMITCEDDRALHGEWDRLKALSRSIGKGIKSMGSRSSLASQYIDTLRSREQGLASWLREKNYDQSLYDRIRTEGICGTETKVSVAELITGVGCLSSLTDADVVDVYALWKWVICVEWMPGSAGSRWGSCGAKRICIDNGEDSVPSLFYALDRSVFDSSVIAKIDSGCLHSTGGMSKPSSVDASEKISRIVMPNGVFTLALSGLFQFAPRTVCPDYLVSQTGSPRVKFDKVAIQDTLLMFDICSAISSGKVSPPEQVPPVLSGPASVIFEALEEVLSTGQSVGLMNRGQAFCPTSAKNTRMQLLPTSATVSHRRTGSHLSNRARRPSVHGPLGTTDSIDRDAQINRVKMFRSLLNQYPRSDAHRQKIIDEARNGPIPLVLRGEIWAVILGVDDRRSEKIYSKIDRNKPTSADRQISVDVPRCHQYHPKLASPEGRMKLKNVLRSWVLSNPKLVYWQGLDSLSAPFVSLNFYNEARAFGCLYRLVHKYVRNFFLPDNSIVMQEYLMLFSQLLTYHDPALSVHLRDIGFFPEHFAIPWFLTLFAHIMPLDRVYVLWDKILLGPECLPLFFALAIMQQGREFLLHVDFNSSALFLSNIQSMDTRQILEDADELYAKTPSSLYEKRITRQFPTATSQDLHVQELVNSMKEELTPRISAGDMRKIEGVAVVIDVRDEDRFSVQRIPGAIHAMNLTMDTLEPKKGLPVIVVAEATSNASVELANRLVRHKVPYVSVLHGGIESYFSQTE